MKLITAILASAIITTVAFATQTAIADTSSDIPGELFTKAQRPEIYCLAKNIYFESRSDNLAGKYAVADVVLNRVKDRRYPGTICEVVHQGEKTASGNMKINRCQFSWYCDGKPDTTPNTEKWIEAQSIAYQLVVNNTMRGITEGATHYHATYVDPYWNKRMDLIGRIGAHIFYRAP